MCPTYGKPRYVPRRRPSNKDKALAHPYSPRTTRWAGKNGSSPSCDGLMGCAMEKCECSRCSFYAWWREGARGGSIFCWVGGLGLEVPFGGVALGAQFYSELYSTSLPSSPLSTPKKVG